MHFGEKSLLVNEVAIIILTVISLIFNWRLLELMLQQRQIKGSRWLSFLKRSLNLSNGAIVFTQRHDDAWSFFTIIFSKLEFAYFVWIAFLIKLNTNTPQWTFISTVQKLKLIDISYTNNFRGSSISWGNWHHGFRGQVAKDYSIFQACREGGCWKRGGKRK